MATETKKLNVPRKRDLDALVTLRIDAPTVKKLDLIARKQNRSRSDVIRLALAAVLA
jgi:predicted transcriptional regulator